ARSPSFTWSTVTPGNTRSASSQSFAVADISAGNRTAEISSAIASRWRASSSSYGEGALRARLAMRPLRHRVVRAAVEQPAGGLLADAIESIVERSRAVGDRV